MTSLRLLRKAQSLEVGVSVLEVVNEHVEADGIKYPIRGHVDQRFDFVLDAFRRNFESSSEIGATVNVVVDGHTVIDLWGGYQDRVRTKAWLRDTIVNMMSVGKVASAVSIFWLVERGVLDPDVPVAQYWPAFSAAGKAGVTLQWVLDHRAGLPVLDPGLAAGAIYDHDAVCRALAAQAPLWQPGSAAGYHILTQGFILSEVIRRTDGRSLGRLFAEEFAAPLHLDYWIGLPAELQERCADFVMAREGTILDEAVRDPLSWQGRAWAQLNATEDFNSSSWRTCEIPSANGHGHARAVARLMAALAAGGSLDGVRVLREETVERMAAAQHNLVEVVMGRAYHQASGLLRNSPPIVWMGPNPGAFGHHGVGGAIGVADPDARLGFSYAMNQMHSRIDNGPRAGNLLAAVYEVLG